MASSEPENGTDNKSDSKSALPFRRGPSTFWADPNDIFLPGIDDADEHYLTDIDKERHAIDEGMVLNMMQYGIIHPVIVTKEGDRIVGVAGRRRVLHAREASRRIVERGGKPLEVEVRAKRGSQQDLFGIFISENELRKGDTVLGRAKKAERMRNFGATDEDISVTFGVTTTSVYNWKKLLELNPKVLKLIESGRLTASAALVLHGLPFEEQYAKAQEAMAAAPLSGRGPSGRKVGESIKPERKTPPAKIINRLIETQPEGVSGEFLRGLQFGRGLISPQEAGVAPVIDQLVLDLMNDELETEKARLAVKQEKAAARAEKKAAKIAAKEEKKATKIAAKEAKAAEKAEKAADRAARKAEKDQQRTEREARKAAREEKKAAKAAEKAAKAAEKEAQPIAVAPKKREPRTKDGVPPTKVTPAKKRVAK